MSKLDEIFNKRLAHIRDELNSYIEERLPKDEDTFLAPREDSAVKEKKTDAAMEKFLSFMRLSDDYDDSDDSDIEEECTTLQPKDSAPKIPDFLSRKETHSNLDKVLEKREESFSEMLFRMIDEKGLKDPIVYKRANIDRRLFSKIRSDRDYAPSKKTAIALCLALELETDEAKKLLATAGYTLSSSSRFDLIIMYLIENGEHNICFVNMVLDDYGEGTLSR